MPCMECDNGTWECGKLPLCGHGVDWEVLGIINVPLGIGRLTVPVKVEISPPDANCKVRFEPLCPKIKCDPVHGDHGDHGDH